MFALFALVTSCPSCHGATLSMQKATALAFKERPSLQALKFETKTKEINSIDALTGYFPQAALSAQKSTGCLFPSGTPTPGADSVTPLGTTSTIALSGSQLIFSFAGPIDLYQIAKKDAQAARIAESLHQDQIRISVETNFLQAWLLEQKKRTIEEQEAAAKYVFGTDTHKNKVGLINKNEFLKAKANFSKEISQTKIYTDDLEISKHSLERAIGQSLDKVSLNWEYKNYKIKPIAYYHELAKANRKEIRIKDKEIRREELSKTYYAKGYLPSISAFGEVSRNTFKIGNPTTCKEVGLSFTWNIFDGLSNIQKARASSAQKTKAILEKEDLLQQIKLDVEKSYFELLAQEKLLEAQEVEFESAQNEFVLNKKKEEIGDSSRIDFAVAKFAFEAAKFKLESARVAVALKERVLFFACGYPVSLVEAI